MARIYSNNRLKQQIQITDRFQIELVGKLAGILFFKIIGSHFLNRKYKLGLIKRDAREGGVTSTNTIPPSM